MMTENNKTKNSELLLIFMLLEKSGKYYLMLAFMKSSLARLLRAFAARNDGFGIAFALECLAMT